jgi:hypothetical protein
MRKQFGYSVVVLCSLQTLFVGLELQSDARDLTKVLEQGIGNFCIDCGPTPEIGSAIAAAVVSQALTQQLPLASVAPAFTYRLNPATDIYERSTRVPGPLFAERALTLGDKQLNFGVGYSYIDFDTLNGEDLINIRAPALQLSFFTDEAKRQSAVPPGVRPLQPGRFLFFSPFFETRGRIRLSVQAHVITLAARYGLTDRWDVGLVLPIMHTFLRSGSESVPVVDTASGYRFAYIGDADSFPISPPLFYVDSAGNQIPKVQVKFVKSQLQTSPFRVSGSATGVGDITLRSKYHFWKIEEGGAALGLTLQLPSGEKRNFQGTGETHLSTFLYFSQVIQNRLEPHLNIGLDFNADDVDRSSFLYAVGTTLLIGKNIGLVFDFIGRSEFGRIQVHFPPSTILSGNVLDRPANQCTTTQPCMFQRSKENPNIAKTIFFPFFPERIKRNDIVNFSFGLRYALGESGSVFFGGFIPLNNDGFRADFIPSGGVEYTF